jgi:Tfp pilus assembly protein PilV
MSPRLRRQRGISLVESLVGLLILSMGLLGALRLQSWLRLNGDIARQRTEAVRLAQQDMEQMRGFADTAAFREITDRGSESGGTPTAFTLSRSVSAQGTLKSNQVSVSWLDRSGGEQTIQLHSSIAGVAPVYSAALTLPSQDRAFAPRRHLPPGAKWLGVGRSVLRPSSRSTVAWIINNATGAVIAQCSVAATTAGRDISDADLSRCTDIVGVLLSGHIRFSLGANPDAVRPSDAPLALTLTPAQCEIEVVTSPEHYLAYVCLVPGGLGAREPLHINPVGWAFGSTAATFKACRYAAAPQNYLVIRGDASCPVADTQHNEASVATLQYQP